MVNGVCYIMKYSKLSEVPEQVREFYVETPIYIDTGASTFVKDEYTDGGGNSSVGVDMVGLTDVDMVVTLKFRPTTKLLSDLTSFIMNGADDGVLDMVMDEVITGIRWSYFDKFTTYYKMLLDTKEYNKSNPDNLKSLPEEPIKQTVEEIRNDLIEVTNPYRHSRYKVDRGEAVDNLLIEVDGHVLDGNEVSQDRMVRAITILRMKPEGTTTHWKLADNSIVELNLDQFERALEKAAVGLSEIWFSRDDL